MKAATVIAVTAAVERVRIMRRLKDGELAAMVVRNEGVDILASGAELLLLAPPVHDEDTQAEHHAVEQLSGHRHFVQDRLVSVSSSQELEVSIRSPSKPLDSCRSGVRRVYDRIECPLR